MAVTIARVHTRTHGTNLIEKNIEVATSVISKKIGKKEYVI